jgi:hypothetical protein
VHCWHLCCCCEPSITGSVVNFLTFECVPTAASIIAVEDTIGCILAVAGVPVPGKPAIIPIGAGFNVVAGTSALAGILQLSDIPTVSGIPA